MALVPIRIPRTSKPPLGTPIDWSNPLVRGLLLSDSVLLNEGGGKPFKLNGLPVITMSATWRGEGVYCVGQNIKIGGVASPGEGEFSFLIIGYATTTATVLLATA